VLDVVVRQQWERSLLKTLICSSMMMKVSANRADTTYKAEGLAWLRNVENQIDGSVHGSEIRAVAGRGEH